MRRILIYGSSLFLAGLAAQVRRLAGIEIQTCDSLERLGDLAAVDAVLVDLNDSRAADLSTLLRARPDLQVIGVNAATSALTMLSGQVYLAETIDDVLAHLARRGPCQD